ncbi:HlyD family secretion protein [Roseomonas marmotae]|uniref:HlyD family secretion protein n=1 Tax=Roseomonas marmotae TaxID=2768161 RepID=A0ABS3KI25_9PROT|nr:HlyD family secretion protein [Roseomonas marmotae]MBO1077129.1 HlyD family secretion protein [Roseomonas marmotae]QTI81155.1 HlyD family secretion protein [Roseomonas marmotae]
MESIALSGPYPAASSDLATSRIAPVPQGPEDASGVGTAQSPQQPARPLRHLLPNLLPLVLAALLCGGIALGWDDWVGGAATQWTDDAYLASDLTPLAALVAAPVKRVLVDDFQAVRKGDLLIELDERTYAAALAQAEANVRASRAALDDLNAQQALQEANIASAEAAVAGAQAGGHRDSLEAARQQQLLASGIAGTRQKVEQAEAAAQVSAAQVAQARAGVEAARRQLAVLQSKQPELEAALAAAEASRDLARINLGYTQIGAPTDGVVSQRRVFPGQYVGIGTQVISVVPLSRIYVLANFKETQLGRMRQGQPADIRVDAFPGLALKGHVASWSPGTGSQFALLPPDNATGNFTKVVQRLPVKIALDLGPDLIGRLRPGMSVEVTVHVEEPIP